MDPIRGPFPAGPILPIGLRQREQLPVQRLQGTIVGVRAGRSGEVGTTHILTIKLLSPSQDISRLLHGDVEVIVRSKR
jgi:hypothetical protein